MRHRVVRSAFVTGVLALLSSLWTPSVDACSCGYPQPRLLTPLGEAAPRNAKIRVAIPSQELKRGTLRLESDHVAIAFDMTAVEMGGLTVLELTPTSLPAGREIQVALVREDRTPSTLVFGAFTTSDKTDNAPPMLSGVTGSTAFEQPSGGMCTVAATWAEIALGPASDPDRPKAQLVYGVWLPDAAGKLDPSQAPSAMLTRRQDKLQLSNNHLCDPLKVKLPRKRIQVAVAAFDEVGQRSQVFKVWLDLHKPRRP